MPHLDTAMLAESDGGDAQVRDRVMIAEFFGNVPAFALFVEGGIFLGIAVGIRIAQRRRRRADKAN
ncbi:MAG: hypothetical protein V3T86_09675 [Planctomycetota bacterium]